nr:C-type lectin 2 [Tropidolaemus subannulatus]
MGRFIFVSFSLLVVFLSLSGTGAGQRCPPGWSSFNQSCYQVFKQPMRWAEAEMSCTRKAEGSHLASIQSLAESAYVAELVSNRTKLSGVCLPFGVFLCPRVWIGLSDPWNNGNWQWTDGSTFGYQSWKQGQPDNFLRNEYCVELLPLTEYLKWNDVSCTSNRYFVCKF